MGLEFFSGSPGPQHSRRFAGTGSCLGGAQHLDTQRAGAQGCKSRGRGTAAALCGSSPPPSKERCNVSAPLCPDLPVHTNYPLNPYLPPPLHGDGTPERACPEKPHPGRPSKPRKWDCPGSAGCSELPGGGARKGLKVPFFLHQPNKTVIQVISGLTGCHVTVQPIASLHTGLSRGASQNNPVRPALLFLLVLK